MANDAESISDDYLIETKIGNYESDVNLSGALTGIQETKKPADNKFTIGQRNLNNDEWELQSQSGIINWLKINKLKVRRVVILKDFINYDIYADVYGRVDNVDGTYTGEPQLTSGQRQDAYQGQTMEAGKIGIKPVRPSIKAPIKADLKPVAQLKSSIEPLKAMPRVIKPIIKKGTKY